MFERVLFFALQARGRGPRLGILFIVLGVVILFAFLISGLVSLMGNAAFVVANLGPAIDFLGTGEGTLVSLGVAVFLILLGVASLRFLTPHHQQMPSAEQAAEVAVAAASPGNEPALEQLRAKLREVEQERERLQVDKETLTEELERVLSDASEVGEPTVEQEEQPIQRKAQDEHEKRKMLMRTLAIAHSKDIRLDNSSGSSVILGTAQLNNQAFRECENETYAFIRAAFVESKHAESFLAGSGILLPSSIQPLLADRLWALVWIILAADNAELRPDFDPQDWAKRE